MAMGTIYSAQYSGLGTIMCSSAGGIVTISAAS